MGLQEYALGAQSVAGCSPGAAWPQSPVDQEVQGLGRALNYAPLNRTEWCVFMATTPRPEDIPYTRGSIRVLVLPLPTCMILDKLAMSINFFIISNEIMTVKIITPAQPIAKCNYNGQRKWVRKCLGKAR